MKNSDMVRLTQTSRQTLNNWKKNKPMLYEVVHLGCEVKQAKRNQCKTLEQTHAT
ncbi:hypothetical protein UFOVP136_30 [uncultured Caudovirales phage]|uniref:DNA-binding protein n=1 Tax=uncultured Caudovirales phage TaxID=2100421 RepID=A0A6J5LFN7_9CAUD|nr:hypothetical protein UFOVP136_30 [uncultured Caudovirales phage]